MVKVVTPLGNSSDWPKSVENYGRKNRWHRYETAGVSRVRPLESEQLFFNSVG